MAIITIVGSGMMGSALAFPAAENGNEVRLVGTHLDTEIIENCKKENRHPKFNKPFPKGVKFYQIEELETALAGANAVISGVSSFGVEWFASYVIPRLKEGEIVLSVTKGLLADEDGNLTSYPEFWEQAAQKLQKNVSFNAIGGPCTSYELVAHDQTEVAFCGRDFKTLAYLKSLMQTGYYHISLTPDVRGLEAAVALKNGYALGIALTIGVNKKQFGENSELHYNSQAGVFFEAAKEMQKLLRLFAAKENSYYIGLGDLYVTVYGGRTRLVGILLGEGYTIGEAKAKLNGVTLESLVVIGRVAKAVKILIKKGRLNAADFPLLLHADEILSDEKPVDLPWNDFTFSDF